MAHTPDPPWGGESDFYASSCAKSEKGQTGGGVRYALHGQVPEDSSPAC